MKTLTVEELQQDFDSIMEQVEVGESFIISDGDKSCVLIPANYYEFLCDHNDGC